MSWLNFSSYLAGFRAMILRINSSRSRGSGDSRSDLTSGSECFEELSSRGCEGGLISEKPGGPVGCVASSEALRFLDDESEWISSRSALWLEGGGAAISSKSREKIENLVFMLRERQHGKDWR